MLPDHADPGADSRHYTTSRGVRLTFVGIATLLDKLSQTHEQAKPKPPTYTVKTATGAMETHPHDPSTLESEEDRAAWQEYLRAAEAAQTQYNADMLRLILLKGVRCDLPTDESWVEEHELMGIPVPEKPVARRLHWLETEVVGSVADATQIVTGVMIASGMDEGVIRQAEQSFRGDLQRDSAGAADPTDPAGQTSVAGIGAVHPNGSGSAERDPRYEPV